jgi:RHS repeat-associated protein
MVEYEYTSSNIFSRARQVSSARINNTNNDLREKNVGIQHIVADNTRMNKTVIVSTGENYVRHVSFFEGRVISDYAYETGTGNSFISNFAVSNDFDYFRFINTFANTKDLTYRTYDRSRNYHYTERTISLSQNSESGTVLAINLWIRVRDNSQTRVEARINGNALQTRYLFNRNISSWQFATIILSNEELRNANSLTVRVSSNETFNIDFLRIVRFPQIIHPDRIRNFSREYYPSGQLFRMFQYNTQDHTISMVSFTYDQDPLMYFEPMPEYPASVFQVNESVASANLTREQFMQQARLTNRTEHRYTNGFLTNIRRHANGWTFFPESFTYNEQGMLTSHTDINGIRTDFSLEYRTQHNPFYVSAVRGTEGSPDIIIANQYCSGILRNKSTGNITTHFGFNANRDLNLIMHNNFNTNFEHHNDGSLRSINVPDNTLTDYSRSDTLGRITYGNNQGIRSVYDDDGRLITILNSDNSATTFSYNSRNELSQISHPHIIAYRFNRQVGAINNEYRAINGTDELIVRSSHADEAGNRTRISFVFGSMQYEYRYSFNRYGQLTALNKFRWGNYANNLYNYDNHQRLISKNCTIHGNTFNQNFLYGVHAGNTIGSPEAVGGIKNTIQESRLTVNGNQRGIYQYSYYPNGNLQRISYNDQLEVEYFYDGHNRLIRENHPRMNYRYQYDDGGNILSLSGTAVVNGVAVGGFSRNFGYSSEWKDQLVGVGGTSMRPYTFTYDGAGNPIVYKNVNLFWRNGRELANYDGNRYLYDFAGIRIQKRNSAGVETNFFVQGSQVIAEKTGDDTKWFIYDETGVSGMIWQHAEYWFEKNILGDIIRVYASGGSLVGTYTYDAWGNILSQIPTTHFANAAEILDANPFRYRGYYYDTETRLYYLNSRYYDPELRRFLNPDVPTMLFITATNIDGANLYQYCYNNPVVYFDPTGKIPFLIAIGIIAGAALLGGIIGGAISSNNEGSFWTGFGNGAIAGGILGVVGVTALLSGGATASLAKAWGGGFWANVGAGALVGAGSGAIIGGGVNLLEQGVANGGFGGISWEEFRRSVLFGVAIGAGTGAALNAIGFGMNRLGFDVKTTFGWDTPVLSLDLPFGIDPITINHISQSLFHTSAVMSLGRIAGIGDMLRIAKMLNNVFKRPSSPPFPHYNPPPPGRP